MVSFDISEPIPVYFFLLSFLFNQLDGEREREMKECHLIFIGAIIACTTTKGVDMRVVSCESEEKREREQESV